jgi:hypothetical protein
MIYRLPSIDAVTVQLRWTGSSPAFGYRFWVRNINDGSAFKADESSSDVPCYGITYLIPGVWNYEFCVSAFNGNDESTKGNCVVATSVYTLNVASCPTYAPTHPELGIWHDSFSSTEPGGEGEGGRCFRNNHSSSSILLAHDLFPVQYSSEEGSDDLELRRRVFEIHIQGLLGGGRETNTEYACFGWNRIDSPRAGNI